MIGQMDLAQGTWQTKHCWVRDLHPEIPDYTEKCWMRNAHQKETEETE